MNKEQLQLFDKKTAQAIQNLIGFSYDNKTDKTRNVKNFLEDKKGICFDFVNYLYSVNKKCQCYFVWFNNKESSTHTFIILNGYYIETTPETNRKNTLSSIYIEKATPENIIKRLQLADDRIKLISHSGNLGVYRSRMESILNSNSEFIILMDPDDMYFNVNLLKELYEFNIKNNIDIIEFVVYQQFDGRNRIFFPNNDYETHFHKFNKDIIYQPELSEILYYIPGTKEYSHTICRNIWNKMIRRNIYIKTYNFIGKEYFNDFIITADDMIMNIISYQFAHNYTNINLPGYLYIIRKVSMSRGDGGEKLMEIRALNHLSYFKLFYKYLKEYNKDRNYLYYEMKDLHRFILYMKKTKLKYQMNQINFIQQIMKDKNITNEYKDYLYNILLFFLNE